MLTGAIPTREQLVRRTSELVPLLRKNAPWSEEHRRIHDESIEAMAEAGIFQMRVPALYGGYECDARTMVEVATELARGDGATAWTASTYWIPSWMTVLFPEAVQQEIFSTPHVRMCGTLAPTGTAARAAGGFLVNGKWSFVTGAPHAHWQEVTALLPSDDGQPTTIMALVPTKELRIVDDWFTSGLAGSGSVSTVAEDVFVPAERVLLLDEVLNGQLPARASARSPIYRAPMLPVASVSPVGTVLGLARAAREVFFDRLDRRITYTTYPSQREAPLTHLQVAEAAMKIDETEFHVHRLAALVDTKAIEDSEWTLEDKVTSRADLGMAARLAKETVDLFAAASGGSSIYRNVPIQRIQRDIQAINLHAFIHPDTNAELYGRYLCGLEPNTDYL
ncbi:acyl-CoA dehydrogenase [Amycolatopsis balhimycina DSM 5908]|uniref:Acyl-CoA dehydrogenase n=1 Tax=Amycolatopsis balhimycina DSM 5908 TaxID=1081091 RepID=A0A428VYU1_AMYBA|nr:acyl-CoA dehydrogenase family protein [Amycolatopsis balhimycina]RSM35990.1 acyl-CoA dehydrogenase [Amycolatopsis balhimycina DSM 5908]